MEKERVPRYEIREATIDDVEAIRRMQAQSWCDTYQNDELGVTAEWLKDVTESWLTPQALEESRGFLDAKFNDKTQFYRVALQNEKVVGLLHLSTREDGSKYFEALYTDKKTHGTGLAQKLMALANKWVANHPVDLEVASYNERAKAFYRKYGFVEQEGIAEMFGDKIPTIRMLRKEGVKDEV